jgi:hypothetical protein
MADGFPPMGASAPYTVTDEDRAAIAAAISQDEIVELALTLGNIPAPSGKELEVANYVYDWMAREGFSPRKVGATPERPNIIGTHGGKGVGQEPAVHRPPRHRGADLEPGPGRLQVQPRDPGQSRMGDVLAGGRQAVRLSDRQ